MRNGTSDLWIPLSDVLPLSHRDSAVSEVYYEAHSTRVLYTASISNVDSVIEKYGLKCTRDYEYGEGWGHSMKIKNGLVLFLKCGNLKHILAKNDWKLL